MLFGIYLTLPSMLSNALEFSSQKLSRNHAMAFFPKIQIHLTSNDLNQTRAQTTKECIFQNTLCRTKIDFLCTNRFFSYLLCTIYDRCIFELSYFFCNCSWITADNIIYIATCLQSVHEINELLYRPNYVPSGSFILS